MRLRKKRSPASSQSFSVDSQEVAALAGEVVERIVEPAVELGVARRPEALGLAVHDLVLAAVEPVVLLGRLVAGELEALAHVAVVGVRDARAEVAVRDRLVADLHRLRLGLGDLLLLLAHEVAEVALAGEPPELAHVAAAVHRGADVESRVELRQLGVALVDRHQVVGLLQAGEVEVGLLVELRDEAVGLRPEGVELPLVERRRHGVPRITAVQEISLKTDRKTQLLNITEQVQAALGDTNGAAAALVYVPHTTAGVTINEHADPLVAEDLENAMQRIVDDGWDWKHVEDPDGPNAPSHVRSSLTSTQILVPLRDGKLALGQWQGIFFCEFDGPRDRKVFVTSLQLILRR